MYVATTMQNAIIYNQVLYLTLQTRFLLNTSLYFGPIAPRVYEFLYVILECFTQLSADHDLAFLYAFIVFDIAALSTIIHAPEDPVGPAVR